MEEVIPQPTKRKVDKVEQKVKELEQEVKKVKQEKTTPNTTMTVKEEVKDLTTNPTESPRKVLTITMIVGVVLLFLGALAFILMKGVLLWMSIILLLAVVFLSDRAQ